MFEYSFGTRTLREAAGEEEPAEDEPVVREAPRRREPKRTSVEVLEPVMDMFDEPGEIVFLFELPGVERKDLRCILDGDILLLDAKTGERLYRKETLVPESESRGRTETETAQRRSRGADSQAGVNRDRTRSALARQERGGADNAMTS